MTKAVNTSRAKDSAQTTLTLIGISFVASFAATDVQAQSLSDNGWSYTIAPYAFGAGLSGSVAANERLPTAEVDLSFAEILENLDMAGMILLNAQNGRWGITGDLQYIRLKSESKKLRPLYDTATVEVTNKIFSVYGEYKLTQSSQAELWGVFGARYWNVENDIGFSSGRLPKASANVENSWTDPVLGLRGRYNFDDRTYLTGWAYAGGFGVGSDSMADVFAAVGYQFTSTTAGVLGYRFVSVDRRDGDFIYDVEMDGLMAGLSFSF